MAENETTIIQISRDLSKTWQDYTRVTPEQADDFFRSASVTAPRDGRHFRALPDWGMRPGGATAPAYSHTTLRRTVHATFDASLLSDAQLAYLEGAAMAQGEASPDYPDVPTRTWITVDENF